MQDRTRGLSWCIEGGVYLSYLSTPLEDSLTQILTNNPAATHPLDLPPGPERDFLIQFFEDHFFTPSILSPPTIVRVLAMGARTPPSAVELFMATSAAFYGLSQACLSAAPTNVVWAQQFDVFPAEVADVLRSMHWSCAGRLDLAVLPAVSYMARLALARDLRVVAPRSSWPSGSAPHPLPMWETVMPHRRHVSCGDLLDDFRTTPSHLESFSLWLVGRPMVLAGPFATLSGTIADCFLMALTHHRAMVTAPSMCDIHTAGFNNWPISFGPALHLSEPPTRTTAPLSESTWSGHSSPQSPTEWA